MLVCMVHLHARRTSSVERLLLYQMREMNIAELRYSASNITTTTTTTIINKRVHASLCEILSSFAIITRSGPMVIDPLHYKVIINTDCFKANKCNQKTWILKK